MWGRFFEVGRGGFEGKNDAAAGEEKGKEYGAAGIFFHFDTKSSHFSGTLKERLRKGLRRMKIRMIATTLLAAALIFSSCGKGGSTIRKGGERSESSVSRTESSASRVIPDEEEAVSSYGFVTEIGTSSVTVELASAGGTEEVTNAGELSSTGVEKTVSVDEDCPIYDENGDRIELTDLKAGTALEFTETPSMLVSIRVIPGEKEAVQNVPESDAAVAETEGTE